MRWLLCIAVAISSQAMSRERHFAPQKHETRLISLKNCKFQYEDLYGGYYYKYPASYLLKIPDDDKTNQYSFGFVCVGQDDPRFDLADGGFFGIDILTGKWRSHKALGKKINRKGYASGYYVNSFTSANGEGMYAYWWSLLNGQPEGNYGIYACVKGRDKAVCALGTVGEVGGKNGVPYVIELLKTVQVLDNE